MSFDNAFGDAKGFKRSVGLIRNPENGHCPICKKRLKSKDNGDLHCSNYSLEYEKEGKCFWHRYNNGLNYWSSAEDVIRVLSKELNIPLPLELKENKR